jgi:hypothetical protein
MVAEHLQGWEHIIKDLLSRTPYASACAHFRKSNGSQAAADGSDSAAVRTELLCDDDLGPILWEVKAGERPSDHSPFYKS